MAANSNAVSAAVRQDVIDRYARGEKGTDIAGRHGIPPTTVYAIASRADLTGHRQGGRAESPKALTEAFGHWVWTNGIARWVEAPGKAIRRAAVEEGVTA